MVGDVIAWLGEGLVQYCNIGVVAASILSLSWWCGCVDVVSLM
jgi:hypothetical protein